MRRGGPSRISLPILLLGYQLMQAGFTHIPPVTLVTILTQVGIFLHLLPLRLPSIQKICISPVSVWFYEDYTRLIFAPLFHVSDWHLYYNMVSLLWKGSRLERRFGSVYYGYLLTVLTLLTSVTLVGLGLAAERVTGDQDYLYTCAVGFSGTLFALKVISTSMDPEGRQYLMGFIPVPKRYACWAELVLIHFLIPNSSFVGHLAGILVGMAYVKTPLKYIIDLPVSVFSSNAPSYTYSSGTSGNTWGQGSGASGYRQPQPRTQPPSYGWNLGGGAQSNENTNDNSNAGPYENEYTGGLNEDEQMQEALRASRQQYYAAPHPAPTAPPSPPSYDDATQPTQAPPPRPGGIYPDLDDVRQRRLNRFQ